MKLLLLLSFFKIKLMLYWSVCLFVCFCDENQGFGATQAQQQSVGGTDPGLAPGTQGHAEVTQLWSACVHTHTHRHRHTHTYVHTHTHRDTQRRAHTDTHMHARSHTQIRRQMQAHTCTNTQTHTHTHTHILSITIHMNSAGLLCALLLSERATHYKETLL